MKPITSITIFHSVTRSFIQFGFQLFSGGFFFFFFHLRMDENPYVDRGDCSHDTLPVQNGTKQTISLDKL